MRDIKLMMKLIAKDPTIPITLDWVDLIGLEDEGAVPRRYKGTALYHPDGSVDVVGNGDSGECYCNENCECDECLRCSGCDRDLDGCNCSSCLTCNECYEHIEECVCDLKPNESCEDCMSAKEICSDCVGNYREDHAIHSCRDRGNTYTSCSMDCGCEHTCEFDSEFIDGEIVSPPLTVDKILGFMDEHHVGDSNSGCGGHRHYSFKNEIKSISILMDRAFNDTYLPSGLYAWAKEAGVREGSAFYRRMEGHDHFCSPPYNAAHQFCFTGKSSERYRRVNYCYANSKEEHGVGTVEIRVLPEFQRLDLMKSATIALTYLVDSFIKDNEDSLESFRSVI